MADFWEQALEGFVHILPPEVREIAELVSTPVPPTPGRRIPAPGEPAATRLNAIDHIVVVMLENRSFDHMLGFLHTDNGNVSPLGQPYEGLNGTQSNPASAGSPVSVFRIGPSTPNAYFMPGPRCWCHR